MKRTGAGPERGLRILGWSLLLLGLPLALFAATKGPNEYRETLGIDALDCDGPLHVYLFAAPALVLYGAGLAINARRWRKPARLAAAIACFIICTALIANVARAWVEEREQAEACASR